MDTQNVYLDFVRRWYWLIAIGMIIALAATHHAVSKRIPMYASTATVQIGRSIQEADPDQNDIAITDRLIPGYAELAKRDPILSAVADTLQVPLTPDDIRARLLVSPVPRTQLIDITVVDVDPVRSAAIANEIARQLVLQGPSAEPEDATQSFVQGQLVDLREKITTGQQSIADLEQQIVQMTSAADIYDAQLRLEALRAQVETWQGSYATFLSSAEPAGTNVVEVVNGATPAAAPIASSATLNYGLGAVIGGGLGVLFALGLSVVNGSIQKPEDLRLVVQSVPLVTIPKYRIEPMGGPIVLNDPGSDAASAYRVLRNVLQMDRVDDFPVKIAVTSSRPGEGKTTTAANLAVVLANSDRDVILVDANLRNPSLDQLFGLKNPFGFSDVMLGDCRLDQAMEHTGHPRLKILGAGIIPPNYTDVIALGRLEPVIDAVSQAADVIVIDTPGIQEEREALIIARQVDAVVVVVESGRLKVNELKQTLELLDRSSVPVLMIAMNKVQEPWLRIDRLPWSRDAKLRSLAAARRRQHARYVSATGGREDHDRAVNVAD